jgi:hypothetical protein
MVIISALNVEAPTQLFIINFVPRAETATPGQGQRHQPQMAFAFVLRWKSNFQLDFS